MKEPNLPPANVEAEEAILGGTAKLAQLLNRTISAVNIDRYVDLVMDKYYRRRVIEVGHKIVDLGYDSTLELEKLLNDSEQEIFSVTQQRIRSDTDQNSEIAMSAFNQLDEENPIYPTGIEELDKLFTGFEPGRGMATIRKFYSHIPLKALL